MPALEVLASLPVKAERRVGYDRDLFADWTDADGDGCDTRDEVLIQESTVKPSVGPGCRASGRWLSRYDGVRTTNPSSFDIDHMVPLAEAWDSGAYRWSQPRRDRFANDLGYAGSLIAVTASSNRSKGDQDPAEWMPPRTGYRCTYAKTWVTVKWRWRLSVDRREKVALGGQLRTCGNPTVRLPGRA